MSVSPSHQEPDVGSRAAAAGDADPFSRDNRRDGVFESMPPRRRRRFERWAILAGWLGVGCVVFSLSFHPLRLSHDEWWHLKTGKWIVENGCRLPEKDIFTYTAESYDWDNHEWLSQIVMYLIWRWGEGWAIGGWRAVILTKSLILIAAYLLLGAFMAQRAGPGIRGAAIAIFLALIAAAVGRRTFWPRPPVISYLFMVLFLYAMWKHRAGRLRTRWLWGLAALMPLWANLHGGFLLGEIIVASYCAGEAVEFAWGRWIARRGADSAQASFERLRVYLLLGALCGIGSLLNPFGYRLYLLPFRVMRSKDLTERLSELLPPQLAFAWAYVFLAALVGIGFAVLAARFAARRSGSALPVGEVLLVALFFQQSISHVRHLPLFGIVAAPTAAWMLREWWGSGPSPRFRALKMALVGGALVCGAWLIFLPGEWPVLIRALREPSVARRLPPSNFKRNLRLLAGEEIEAGAYPERAMDFVLEARLPGRMYNRDHLAGYLIWRLSPEYTKVFTDQRFDLFGGDFFIDELSVVNAWPKGFLPPRGTPVPDWQKVIERWNINWLFVERVNPIHKKLLNQSSDPGLKWRWSLVYWDHLYAIWIKDTPPNRPWIEKYEKRAPPPL
ncbi:MAG TPA: hypothetical protein VM492_07935 [Sumerlaeia bacterium]|nr:hypothetical protein [Sumerlaeia bacterium]